MLEYRHVETSVLVLNASYEPLQFVSLRKAISMLHREVAVLEEVASDGHFGPFPVPKVLRLVKYVSMKWRNRPLGWSRQRVLARDGYACAYCRGVAKTIDHLTPVSRGGANTWENTVAACMPCNQKKKDRSPGEANMRLLVDPVVPTYWDICRRISPDTVVFA
jgi:hypothetical protein